MKPTIYLPKGDYFGAFDVFWWFFLWLNGCVEHTVGICNLANRFADTGRAECYWKGHYLVVEALA